jgi:type IV pilus assembly protein PilO
VANLSRIVTLHDMHIAGASKDATGGLIMEATARTYRYLDPAELESIAAEKRKKNKGNKPDDKGGKP